jgi:NodT family efflux transporter outer membrane factor (OMF) lipoprotein
MKLSVRFSDAKLFKPAIAIAVACSILAPSGCIPNLRKPDPGLNRLPETFKGSTSPDNSATVGIDEFYTDPLLLCLIQQALSPIGNRELKILNEEVQIARNEILARSGAYLPFVTGGTSTGLNRYSRFTEEGAGLLDDQYLPGKHFTNPFGNYLAGVNLNWQIDIYRQLRNARDAAAQRYVVASERRNYFVTRLVAEIAENYYGLVALDARLQNLNRIIALQEQSLEIARARKLAARGTDLPVQRFQAEVRKNQSEKLIVNQDIIQSENRINFLVNRFPQPVERTAPGFTEFFDLRIHDLSVGVPSQLLLNRPDIRQAERDMAAAGLDVQVARVNFFPQLFITGGVGLQSFILTHMFEPNAVIGNITGGLIGPLVNFRAIQAEYLSANARQLQALYSYQRIVLQAITDVINRISKVDNYARSIEIKKQQRDSLEAAVLAATRLYQLPRGEFPIDYLDVLTAQNELFAAIRDLIDLKGEQLAAVANTYQALGGGLAPIFAAETGVILPPLPHHSGPPSPAIPPPQPWQPPEGGPPLQTGSPVPHGPPPDVAPPSPAPPPPPPEPVNAPVQEKPATELEPLQQRP